MSVNGFTSIKKASTLRDDAAYFNAVETEEEIVMPLSGAFYDILDAYAFLEEATVDNAEQREYIRAQVDEMVYQLKRIRDKVEG